MKQTNRPDDLRGTLSASTGEFSQRYAGLVEKLRAQNARWIRDAGILNLPANVPTWTETGIQLECGEQLTVLAAGRVIWSRDADIVAGSRYHLWARIGDEPVFRIGSDTATISTAKSGALQLCVHHGTWASPDGTLASSLKKYASVAGEIDVLVIRWGEATPEQGLTRLRLRPTRHVVRGELWGGRHESGLRLERATAAQ